MITLINGKQHNVIKRDGSIEPYDENKMKNVLYWAIEKALKEEFNYINDNLKNKMVNEILQDTQIKIYDRIHISKLFDAIIETTVNKISELQHVWDKVARNLLIQKYYKEIWGIKRNEYPNYADVIKKGASYNVYNQEIISSFSYDEIQELNDYIKPDRDFNFTFGGLYVFMDKYALKYSKNKWLELPQHTFMRVAIQLHYKDKKRIENIKKRYDMMSKFEIATATPIVVNALKPDGFNPTSCVLIECDDDTESIMETARSMSVYSKNLSGLGVDISRVRAIGSQIGKQGVSSGVVPFVKIFESVISGFNQLGTRPGSAAIYFPWWHYQSPEMIMLKDAGGKDDDRARRLKYAIKLDEVFFKKVENNEEIVLLDPKQAKELIDYSDEFKDKYEELSNKNIRKRKVKARDLAFSWLKVYQETGNLYSFFIDNANKFRVSADSIRQGNLCCAEVMLPTKPLRLINTKLSDGIEIREVDGEIGICNLTSINCIAFDNMTEQEKDEFIYTLLVGMDNQIDYAFYPVKAGEKFNKLHRAIGIGITNYHNWLVSKQIKFSDKKAKEETHKFMESIYYYLVKNSIRLAKERCKYHYYDGSAWDKGKFVWEMYEEHFKKIGRDDLNFELQYDWENLRTEMQQFGVRFEFLSSIPPGASSSLVLGFTEGISPIRHFKQNREGTFNVPVLAPNLSKNRKYYELAWDIDPFVLLDLAAIRQKFLDQSQSLDLFIKNPNSAYDLYKIIRYAHKLGIKSLYYMNSLKAGDVEICESCSV